MQEATWVYDGNTIAGADDGSGNIAIEKPAMYIVENVPGMKKIKVVKVAMTNCQIIM